MRALFYDQQNGFQGIKEGDFPLPEISGNEVLVRVKAFSLNRLDVWVMSGEYPLPIPLPHIFASDASGVAEKTGSSVQHVKAGDEVVIFPGLSCGHCAACLGGRDNECKTFSILGTLSPGVSAEYVKIPAQNVFKKSAGLSFEEAAAIGITYTTAWNSLVLRSGIRQGDTVLVHAAGSGAGSAAVQIAKLFNARVIATVGDDWKRAWAEAIGADVVVNHRNEDFVQAVKEATGGEMADIAVDHIGGETFAKSLSCLKRGGKLVTFGGTSGDEARLGLRQVFGKNITIHGVYVGPKAAFLHCLRLMPHKLRPVIDSVFAFKDVRNAYEKLLSRQVFGKIVVKV